MNRYINTIIFEMYLPRNMSSAVRLESSTLLTTMVAIDSYFQMKIRSNYLKGFD